MYKFGDVFEFHKKSKIKAGDGKPEGKYPFYTSSAELNKYVDDYLIDGGSLVFGTGGNASVHFAQNKFAVSTDCLVAQTNTKDVNPKFVYYYLSGNIHILEQGFKGAGLKHISKAYIFEITFTKLSRKKQDEIVQILDTADNLAQKRKEQLVLLDNYLKSVFLDMFGDPVKNCKQWETVFISKGIDSIKYGTSIPPEFSDFGHPFIRATNIKNGGITSENMLFISELEAKKIMKCKLTLGDVIIVRSGVNTGDNAVVNAEYESAYAAYDIIIRMNNLFHPIFINGLLNSVYKEAVISPLTRRAGQPHLNTTQINNFPIYLPPIELQNKFASIVEQVEKTKQKMRTSLEEMDNHFNALMQRYFE